MKLVEFKDVKPYKAPKHFDCVSLKVQGKEETGVSKFWMGVTHFLPGGGAEYDYTESPTEKVYFVLEGEIVVKSDNETFVLKKNDSLYIPPFEGRTIINESNEPCKMLVVINN